MRDEKTLMESVKDLRKTINVNQATLAAKIGKSIATIQNYEQRGEIPPHELGVFVRLARTYNRPDLAWIFKQSLLENLSPDLLAVIREPEGLGKPEATGTHEETTEEKRSGDKRKIRA